MECSFSIEVRAPEHALATLRDVLEALLAPFDVEHEFLSRCDRLGGHATVVAGGRLLDCLAQYNRAASLRFHAQSPGQLVYHSTYGTPGQEIAAAFAAFLAKVPPVSAAVIEGDYDEDPYGFRYTVRDGEVSEEEGIYADDTDSEAVPTPAEPGVKADVLQAVFAMCERRAITVTPGFRKKEGVTAKYALIRFDDTPPKLISRDFHTRTCVHDFVLTNASSLEPEHFEVLDLETGDILRPTFDLPAFEAALQAMAMPAQLPVSAERIAAWNIGSIPRYFALVRIGSFT